MFIQFVYLMLTIVSASDNVVRDSVNRTTAPNRANFVMDGLTESYGERILRECPKNVKLTILLSPAELKNSNLDPIVNLAVNEGHTLAYRLAPSYDSYFHEINPKKLVERLKEAKRVFFDQYRYKLRWVYFPPSDYDLIVQTKAACKARIMNFGNSIFIDVAFARTKKSLVETEIRRIVKDGEGPIIYFSGNNKDVLDDMEVAYGLLEKYDLKPYPLARCIP